MSVPIELAEDGCLYIHSFYKPLEQQRDLHTSAAHNLLAIGGNGSGKSLFLLGEAVYVINEFPGANVLLLRRDFNELERGLIQDLHETVPKELYRYNSQKHFANWYNGSTIFFGYLKNQSEKDLARYLSSAFVFIGVDELGQFSYKAWEFLSSRNRVNKGCRPSEDKLMPIPRMGGATNPLGPGYGWIKNLWIDKKPVSQLGETEKGEDGKYYQEQKGRQVCVYDPDEYHYTHSTVLNNPYQLRKDPGYIAKLEKLAPALRQKALYGDLDSVAGSYFGNFTAEKNILSLPRDHEDIRWEDWQPIWLGIDFGLAHHTAVYWNRRAKVRGLDGEWHDTVITYREMVVNESAYKVIVQKIIDATPKDAEQSTVKSNERAKLRFTFLSPDLFARETTGHTPSEEMSRLFRADDFPMCSRANNRRVDGALLMYNMIDSGEWMILDSCPLLIRSLETRVRDEDNLEDVLKTDDDLDDCYDACLVAGTMIATDCGEIPIEEITTKHRVWTRKGLRKVIAQGMTNPDAKLFSLSFNGGELIGTSNHPVWADGTFYDLASVRYGMLLECRERVSNFKESSTIDTPKVNDFTCAIISGHMAEAFIAMYSSRVMGIFQKGIMSTIKIAEEFCGILQRIWKRFVDQNISPAILWPHVERPVFVNFAGSRIKAEDIYLDFAAITASQNGAELPAATTSKSIVNCAPKSLSPIDTRKYDFAPVVARGVTRKGRGPVFNLSIEGEQEYFANGILVHNCRYAMLSMLKEKGKPEEVKVAEKIASIEDPVGRAIFAYKHMLAKQGPRKAIGVRSRRPIG